MNLTSASVWTPTVDSGRLTGDALKDFFRVQLSMTMEALSLVQKDRLDLIDSLGCAIHREKYSLAEINRLKAELKEAYG